MKNKSNEYLPDKRTGYAPEKHSLVSESPEGLDSMLPSPVEDPIVVNNIASSEFDYTENPFQGELESNP